MATYHISINKGYKGAAVEHAHYLQREGRFTPERYGAVIASGYANFPTWCAEGTGAFWPAYDQFERVESASETKILRALRPERK